MASPQFTVPFSFAAQPDRYIDSDGRTTRSPLPSRLPVRSPPCTSRCLVCACVFFSIQQPVLFCPSAQGRQATFRRNWKHSFLDQSIQFFRYGDSIVCSWRSPHNYACLAESCVYHGVYIRFSMIFSIFLKVCLPRPHCSKCHHWTGAGEGGSARNSIDPADGRTDGQTDGGLCRKRPSGGTESKQAPRKIHA